MEINFPKLDPAPETSFRYGAGKKILQKWT